MKRRRRYSFKQLALISVYGLFLVSEAEIVLNRLRWGLWRYWQERSNYTYPMIRRTNMACANDRDFRFVFLLAFISIYSEHNLNILLLIIWCHRRICVTAYYICVHYVTTEIYRLSMLVLLYVPLAMVIRTIDDIVWSVARLIGRFQANFCLMFSWVF